MSSSLNLQRSRRGLSSTSISSIARVDPSASEDVASSQRAKSLLEGPSVSQDFDVVSFIRTASTLGLPSIELHGFETTESGREQQTIVLGSGMTSKVVQYVMTDDDKVDKPTGKIVALKTFKQKSSTRFERQSVYETITREIEILRHPLIAGHPNIVQLHFIGWRKAEPFPALAMEHSAHGSLDYLIRSNWSGLHDDQIHTICRHITIDIAMGLHAIQRAGCIHGDLKPENILIISHSSEAQRVVAKLSDFGGSSIYAGKENGQPMHFTPPWSAPEVLNKDPDIDWARADVYSFGLVAGSLWASTLRTGGFGSTRLSKPSSCFLHSYVPSFMSSQEVKDMLWYIKSGPDRISDRSVSSLLYDKLKAALPEHDELRSQIMDVLAPTLEAHFWKRPRVEDVGNSLRTLAEPVGRDIRLEMAPLSPKDLIPPEKRKLNPFSTTTSRDYLSILVEKATVSLEDRKASERDRVAWLDLPEILPEDYGPGKYFQGITNIVKSLLFGNNQSETAESKEARWQDNWKRATLCRFIAFTLLAASKTASNLELFRDMTCEAAMAGDGGDMCIAAFTLIDTSKELELPMRCILSLLALSHSYHAAEILYIQWPEHYRVVQRMIREKPSAFIQAVSQTKVGMSQFMMETLTLYSHEPVLKRPVTLREALKLGLLETIRSIVERQIVPDDLEESVLGLIHGLSSLPDHEAAALAPKAMAMGGQLSFMAPAGSAIAADGFFKGLGRDDKPMSPLAAAIRRGKSSLALAILRLHIESTDKPIVDFDESLMLSLTYLQHEIGDALMSLRRDKPHMCQVSERFDESPDIFLRDLSLCIIDPEKSPTVELEKRLLYGSKYENAYNNTLEVILRRIDDLADGSFDTSLLVTALRYDDVIAVQKVVEALESRGVDMLPYLKDPGNLHKQTGTDNIDITAFDICIYSNTVQSFKFLLQKYPAFSTEVISESGGTLLHEVCRQQGSIAFVEALLRCGANATLKDFDKQTPIFYALRGGNTQAADLLVSHMSDEEVQACLAKYGDEGWSLCFQLLSSLSQIGQTELLKSFRWLADHNGIHPNGPLGMPSWYLVVGEPRPYSQTDQRLYADLVHLILSDKNGFEERMDSERWKGKTILHHAVWNGHIEVVKKLIDHKVDLGVGIEDSGGVLKDTPLHLFDPDKDCVRALDVVCLGLGGTHIPTEVLNAGIIEVQKWTEDLEEIRDLLIDKGSESIFFDRVKNLILNSPETDPAPSFPTNSYLRGGQALAGIWPKPLAEMATPMSLSKTREEMLADTQMKDEVLHNMVRSHAQKLELARRREEEMESVSDDFLGTFRAGVKLKRNEWRLPPGWRCVSAMADDEDEDEDGQVLYLNPDTNELTFHRPPLFRGDQHIVSDHRGLPAQKSEADNSIEKAPNAANNTSSGDLELASLDLNASNDATSPSPPVTEDDSIMIRTENGIIQLPRNHTSLTLEDGSNFLHMAAMTSNANLLALMLREGQIPIDSERHDGCTPLHVAVESSAVEVLESLLKHGADPNRPFPQRRDLRPLHQSLLHGDIDMTKLLIAHGADVNAAAEQNTTALHFFCLGGDDEPELLDVLLDAGADVNAACSEGTVLKMAVSRSHAHSVAKLLDAGARVEENEYLLHAAAQNGDIEIAERLLDAGVDVNQRDDSSWTPIINAVVYEKFEMLRFLAVEHGADIAVLAEEFRFFLKRRDNGKIDRMAIHVGKDCSDATAETLLAEMPELQSEWEIWEPVRVTKVKEG